KSEQDVALKGVDLSSFPVKNIGSKDTVVLIGCYDCDFTRKAYPDIQNIVKDLKTNYIFAHYPIKEKDKYLSNVAYCVNKEYGNKFWAFNDYLFAADKISIYNKTYMERILENFNFDVTEINNCINSEETVKMVEKQFNELRKTNLYGTPTVFINGKAFVGPKPYRVYRAEIKKFIFF
ncbi:MAG: thioredoxin domain-containing protein, partial [Candidatus Falkowbacteria bacterium]|nr:thioredoxin domain-containing protein [Candidatus Falkowbacteria bacterium]